MNNILSEMWRSTQRRIRELEAENEKLRTWSQEKVDKVAMDGRIKFLEMRIRELEDERDAANARCAAMEAKLAVSERFKDAIERELLALRNINRELHEKLKLRHEAACEISEQAARVREAERKVIEIALDLKPLPRTGDITDWMPEQHNIRARLYSALDALRAAKEETK